MIKNNGFLQYYVSNKYTTVNYYYFILYYIMPFFQSIVDWKIMVEKNINV